jgi:hypothetical protein
MNLTSKIFDLVKSNGIGLGKTSAESKYGLEIEAEFNAPIDAAGDRAFYSNWTIHNDGSLRGFGYEFVSPGPQTMEQIRKDVRTLLNSPYVQAHYSPSHRTSTHVHYNVQHHTLEEVLKILLVYFICEIALTKHCGKQREGNLFCLRLCDAEKVMEALRLIVDCKFNTLVRSFDNYKYAALNVANIGKLGSIEFRQFVGTKDAEKVINWVETIEHLVKFSLTFKSIRAIMDSVNEDFMGFVKKATGNLPITNNTNVRDIDHNYSMVFDLFNYIEAREDRLKESQRKKPVAHGYVFEPLNDLIEINQ